jgi:hypothetical protein
MGRGDMSAIGEVVYRVIGPEHAGEVLTVQRAAFVAEARVYGTTEIPPLVETLDQVRHELATTLTMGAWQGSRLVGAARLTLDGPIGWISRVAVAPARRPGGGCLARNPQVPASRWAQEQRQPGHVRAARLSRVLAVRRRCRSGTRGYGQGPPLNRSCPVRGSTM